LTFEIFYSIIDIIIKMEFDIITPTKFGILIEGMVELKR